MNAQVAIFGITSGGPVSCTQIKYDSGGRDALLFRFSYFDFLLIESSPERKSVKTAKRANSTDCLSNLLTICVYLHKPLMLKDYII